MCNIEDPISDFLIFILFYFEGVMISPSLTLLIFSPSFPLFLYFIYSVYPFLFSKFGFVSSLMYLYLVVTKVLTCSELSEELKWGVKTSNT